MAKTWYGHPIHNIKGTNYVFFSDYIELQKRLDEIIGYAEFTERCKFNNKFFDLFIKDIMSTIKKIGYGPCERKDIEVKTKYNCVIVPSENNDYEKMVNDTIEYVKDCLEHLCTVDEIEILNKLGYNSNDSE